MANRNQKSPRDQYGEIKKEIDSRFPPGQFVAVDDGCVIADGETHGALDMALAALGRGPHGLLIVQTGVEYPKEAIIL